MFQVSRQFAFSGLVMGLSALECLASESVVYRFEGGSITITPGSAGSAATLPKRANADQVSLSEPTTVNPPKERAQTIIRAVSLKQEVPAPVPGDVVPQRKGASEPESTVLPLSHPPVMPFDSRTLSPNDGCELPMITPRMSDTVPSPTTTVTQAALYREVYNAIPFSRVEYNSYPNYRHDATMELLFGQMRPTVINRNTGYVNPYSTNYGLNYGIGYGNYDLPYYPFGYGLRIHQSR